jgi:hypothetical protein
MTQVTNNLNSDQPPTLPKLTAEQEYNRQNMAWLWFGPLITVVVLHFWLKSEIDALPTVEPIVLAPFIQAPAGHDDAALRALMWKASAPLLTTITIVVVVWLSGWGALKYWGWKRMRPIFTAVWCAFWLVVGAGLIARYVNRIWQTPILPITAPVVAAVPYATTERGPGGALTWVMPPREESPEGIPWRVKIEGADFHAMPAGTSITLQRARGPLWGVYLTSSNAPQAKPNRPRQAPEQQTD